MSTYFFLANENTRSDGIINLEEDTKMIKNEFGAFLNFNSNRNFIK